MKSIRKKQHGSIGVIVLSVITLIVAGVLGYFYWDNFLKPEQTQNSNNTQQTSVKSEEKTKEETENPNEGYLVIKEWGIRVKMRDAAKVQYKLRDFGPDDRKFQNAGSYRYSITMSVKPEFLEDETCKGASVEMIQLISFNDGSGWQAKEVDGNYYLVTGSPYFCDGGSDSADNKLGKRVLEDFRIENISPIVEM